jgi:hypothetical protein
VVVAVSATKLVAGVLCTAALAGAFVLGQLSGPRRAQAASSRFVVLHVGDPEAIPVIGQRCAVEVEGGFPDLFRQRIPTRIIKWSSSATRFSFTGLAIPTVRRSGAASLKRAPGQLLARLFGRVGPRVYLGVTVSAIASRGCS